MASQYEIDTGRRECLAAPAMVFAPATDIPRERALTQSAVGSLVAAFGKEDFSETAAIEEISRHDELPELRSHVAREVFIKLLDSNLVRSAGNGEHQVYQLCGELINQAEETELRINSLIDGVVDDLFSDLSLTPSAKRDLRDKLLLSLAWTMAAFGRQYAY